MQDTVKILTEVAAKAFLPDAGAEQATGQWTTLTHMIAAMLEREPESEVRRITRDARLAQRHSLRGPPAEHLLGLMRQRLGVDGLLAKLPRPDGTAEKRLARIQDRLDAVEDFAFRTTERGNRSNNG